LSVRDVGKRVSIKEREISELASFDGAQLSQASNSLCAITGTGDKSLRRRETGFVDGSTPELYNLNRDPRKANDLIASQPKRAAAMRKRMITQT
jgi:hypothetical protein